MSKRHTRVKRGATLRVEIHLSNFCAYTAALSCSDVGHLHRMLIAEAARETIPRAPNDYVQRAFDRRADYSRIKGSFGRASISEAKRRTIFERDNRQCSYCGVALEWASYHCDHVEPVSKGGSDGAENLVAACRDCNLSKKDRTVSEWLARK